VKNILAPLNFIKVMPTGGIDASNIQTFAKAGAVAFGIGSALVSSKATVNKAYLETITTKAKQLVTALQAI
jgi:2-dehydro-3-deoxyphosphogluconate aldolase/(4S)-4-hydroxy-2-oxoglutarate aldolase